MQHDLSKKLWSKHFNHTNARLFIKNLLSAYYPTEVFKEFERMERLAEIGEAVEQAFDCSAHGIYFGYIGGSATENFKDIDELLEWYKSQQPTSV